MHLTDEQKNIGKTNFCGAIGSNLIPRDPGGNLRQFLRKAGAMGLRSGAGLGGAYFDYGRVDRPVRVAVLGTGDEGSVLIGAINPEYVQVVAIADIRPYNMHRAFHGDVDCSEAARKARRGLLNVYAKKWSTEEAARSEIRVYADYRDLFEKEKDHEDEETKIEAVIIALPLFLHADAAITAMKHGYHVLTEKLMGHTIAQCKEMGRAAKLFKKHLATGHQRHYNILYDHAVKLLQSGALGDLHYIRAQWHRSNKPGNDSWQPPLPEEIKNEVDYDAQGRPYEKYRLQRELEKLNADLAGFQKKKDRKNYDLTLRKIAQKDAQIMDGILAKGGRYAGLTLKSAEEYGYRSENFGGDYDRPAGEELIRWRLFDRTSAGLMAELGSHQLDAAGIFIAATHDGKKQYPLSVSATAARSLFPGDIRKSPLDRDADDHIHCVFDYAGEGYDSDNPLGKQRKITVAYSSINGNGFGGYGETVFCTRGTLVLETEKDAMLYRGAEVETKTKINLKNAGTRNAAIDLDLSEDGDPLSEAVGMQAMFGDISRGYCEQIEHWAFCIRENPEAIFYRDCPRCTPEVAIADAVIALTTNIAADRNTTVTFKKEWFDIESDETPESDLLEAQDGKPDLSRYGIVVETA